MINQLRFAVGSIPREKARKQLRHALSLARDCRRSQHETLARILELNSDSSFSTDMGLSSVRDADRFRQTIPVGDYERLRPYIDRMQQGDFQALLGRHNRLLMYALTSGTTNTSKLIPITETFLKDYRRGWQCWGIQLLDAYREINFQKILQLVSDYDKSRTPAGTPCGNISGLVQKIQNPLLRSLYSVPPSALKIQSSAVKYYFAIRQSLMTDKLGLITTANPSTVLQLFRILSDQAEGLIRDLYDGTLTCSGADQEQVVLKLGRNRKRAKQLEDLLRSEGTLRPRAVWPGLQAIGVWTGGSAAAYLPQVREIAEGIPIRDHGLHASEGRMTLPLACETSSGLLDIGSHYFEFIPEEEGESDNPTVLEAHQLEEGRSYFILLTTVSGLYRYNIRDVVECTGVYGTTPMLRFLHKGAHIANLTGEKLTESHIVSAVTSVMQETGVRPGLFTVAPKWGDPPRYCILAEFDRFANRLGPGEFAQRVDSSLRKLNSEYHEKRESDRLLPMTAMRLPIGTWDHFLRDRQSSAGGSAEQYKHPNLIPKLEFVDDFTARYLTGNLERESGSLEVRGSDRQSA
ncbi:MAG: GH3 auxin-responsive promoter family protein [Planctomycetaceae bacterium]|nr:GH3 auxin-responsive promoter family protein [Planctomycetaceae bacterium]